LIEIYGIAARREQANLANPSANQKSEAAHRGPLLVKIWLANRLGHLFVLVFIRLHFALAI
jgi:hypothetical protein